MWHAKITWARTESETTDFETMEEAKAYLHDVLGADSNSHGYIYQDESIDKDEMEKIIKEQINHGAEH